MRPISVSLLSLALLLPAALSHPSISSPSPGTSTWQKYATSVISRIWPSWRSHSSCVEENAAAQAAVRSSRYLKDVVLRFNLSTPDQALAIKDAADDLYLDIWEHTDDWVDIRVAKDIVPSLLNLLPKSLSSSYSPLIPESVLNSLVSDYPSPSSSRSHISSHRSHGNIFFQDYQPLSVIYPWLRLLSNMYPDHVRVVVVGRSYEGREILGLRVGKQDVEQDNHMHPRKTVLITGGLHAREWISVSSVNYLAYTLVTQYGKKSIYTNMIDSFDWVFIPVANPDGYDYTWTTDRLWRKNRQPTPIRFCHGIDLDRSFGFKFDQGTPGNPCSESYAGEDAWEAIESSQIRQWALNETQSGTDFVTLLDLHSYSQQVLYPYSYSCDAEPPTLENLEELAFDLVKAMYHSNHGGSYKAVAACEGNVAISADGKFSRLPALESGGGSALDWFYEELRVKFSYQIKLRDRGSYGFLLPKEQIVPTGKEIVAAAEYLGKFLLGEIGLAQTEEPVETKDDRSKMAENHTGETAEKSEFGQHPLQMELRRRR